MVGGKDRRGGPGSSDEDEDSLKGGGRPDVPASKSIGTAGALPDPEAGRGAPKLREKRLKNATNKLIWLPLNTGEHKAIAAGAECKVFERDLQANAAFEKLKQRRWITELKEAPPELHEVSR